MGLIESLETLFPPELTAQKKGRLRDGLKQFLSKDQQAKLYTEFYSTKGYDYFLQGDLIYQLRFPAWDLETRSYSKKYYDSIVISNTCDIDESNKRHLEKQVIIAKLIDLAVLSSELSHELDDADQIIQSIKNQEYSNLMYFPPTEDGLEYVAVLDELAWISVEELNSLKLDIERNRIASLDFFGYYLFMFKLSYHLCRLPEATDR